MPITFTPDLDRIADLTPVVHREDGIVTIPEFFTPDQCAAFITYGESIGFDAATVRLSTGAEMLKNIRNNDRVIEDDDALAAGLWPAVELFLDAFDLESEPVTLNERFRFYRYAPGQQFKRHRDGQEQIRDLISRITVLVYLNDDYEGGQTSFIFPRAVDGQRVEDVTTIHPKTGTALLFRHALLHEGTEVTRGQKYVLRTDVLCEPTS